MAKQQPEQKKGPVGSADNPVYTAPAPAPDLGVTLGGPAMNPKQAAGLEPVNPEFDAEQAEQRQDLPNLQTDHERENTLDPVSGGPSPGITEDTPLTGVQQGQQPTDMSGRPPMQAGDEEILPKIRDALKRANADDRKAGKNQQDTGWRTPADMGIPGGVVARIVAASGAPVETAEMPNGRFFPETGTRYRLKSRG